MTHYPEDSTTAVTVTVHEWRGAWKYTLVGLPGGFLYSSQYRYRSEAGARRAAARDLAALPKEA